jgi:methylmalonyl-CoA mutase N-terminal domain/subunit
MPSVRSVTAAWPSTRPPTWRRCSDIPLGDVTTSMTISGPAVPVFCMYLVAAERQGVDIGVLNGTLQTDIFKEYIAQKEWLFEPEPHLRLIGDLMEFCTERIPAYKPLVGLGLPHPRGGSDGRAGVGVHARRRVRLCRARAVARAWTSRRSRPGCRSSSTRMSTSSRRSRNSVQRGGSGRGGCEMSTAPRPTRPSGCGSTPRPRVSLTAQQPYNNVVRTAVEALAAVLGGTNSLHTNALDETLALPTEQAAEIALRTQQVIMEETGVVNVADPLGGSWYVEALTDRIEAEAEAIFQRIKDLGVVGRQPGPSGQIEHPIGPMTSGICAASRRAGSPARSRTRPSPTSSRWRRATSGSSASTASPSRSAPTWRSSGSAMRSRLTRWRR